MKIVFGFGFEEIVDSRTMGQEARISSAYLHARFHHPMKLAVDVAQPFSQRQLAPSRARAAWRYGTCACTIVSIRQ